VPRGEEWLTAEERAVLERLAVPKRRGDWLLGRWTAKRALVAAGEADREGDVSVLAAPSGAPEAFVLGRPGPVALSLTHSHGVAVAALAPAGVLVGVDLERVEVRSSAFLADWFTEAEQAFAAAGQPGEPGLSATLVWSAKEAVMKALREGLRIPPKAIEVAPVSGPADGAWRPYEARGPASEEWHGWWRAEGGYTLAVVSRPVPGPPERIG
jgi:4'-phosphopantetheinyl transferase